MGKFLSIPTVEIPRLDPRVERTFNDFEEPTLVEARPHFTATEMGIDGTDDVMVIGSAFSEEGLEMTMTPIHSNTAVRYMDLGAATNGEVFRMNPAPTPFDHNLLDHDVMKGVFHAMGGVLPLPAPISEALATGLEGIVEEILELDESDLIFDQDEGVVSGTIVEPTEGPQKDFMTAWKNAEGPVYLMPMPSVFDLTKKFDFTDVETSHGAVNDSQEVSSPWTQTEESWFVDPEAWARSSVEDFSAERTEIIPRAQIISNGEGGAFSRVGEIFQKIWQAWVKATGFPMFW